MENVGGKNRSQATHIVVKVGLTAENSPFINLPQNMCEHLVLLPTQQDVLFCILYQNVDNHQIFTFSSWFINAEKQKFKKSFLFLSMAYFLHWRTKDGCYMEHKRHLSIVRIKLKMCVSADNHMAEAAVWSHMVTLPRGAFWNGTCLCSSLSSSTELQPVM